MVIRATKSKTGVVTSFNYYIILSKFCFALVALITILGEGGKYYTFAEFLLGWEQRVYVILTVVFPVACFLLLKNNY